MPTPETPSNQKEILQVMVGHGLAPTLYHPDLLNDPQFIGTHVYDVPRDEAETIFHAWRVLEAFQTNLEGGRYPSRIVEQRRVLGPRRDERGKALEEYPPGPQVPDSQSVEEIGNIRWFTSLGAERQKRLREAAARQPGFRE
jgi:hypothetical protein